ncbi:hypothetical protein DIURU_003018 [Diutina rugosa]|uniref:Sof1-like protein domain-containing protein n=1 Tax=Diutina rugosa TaxID=5481 RepID=A0A642US89_DIURU|nr:uncharacterized protein DIURU_003018 [Diutina rugosa]KAA8901967.1 hypothetical protein DIURU_003018 [Diutina rugosa]
MKIKTIKRSSDNYVPVRNTQESAMPRNLDPALHPFERAREYTKALTATKLDRMFAKPFIGQLGDGHRDGVYCIAKNYRTTNHVASASGDGVIKYWNLGTRDETISFKAHYGMVGGLVVTPDNKLLSCGADKTIKMWSVFASDFDLKPQFADDEVYQNDENRGLVKTFLGEHAFSGIDHHQDEGVFVTGGALIQLWDSQRTKPVSNLTWGADNVTTVRFNKTETNVIASSGSDNAVVLYDIRTNSAVQKVVTDMRQNAICWNPMEAYMFASASEDHNSYLWDMRYLSSAKNIYKDHVAAVMDIDFSPTGEELVTGSYDKTIRIYKTHEGHSRDIYHTKRMQRVFCTKFTTDSKYILSGSDDTNIRVWRANASERAGIKSAKQRQKLEYDAALRERYKYMPEIRRIARHRHLPVAVKKAQEIKRIELSSLKRREENDRKSTGEEKVPERKQVVRGTAFKRDE